MPRRLLSAAAAGALLLGLAACGDVEEGPVTTAPPEININGPSDGGGDEEPTAAAPNIPPPDPADYAGMDERTAAGAEQSFKYYVAVSMWAHQTGDTSQLETLQRPACSGCSEMNHAIPELKKHGDYWSEFTISEVGTTLHESTKYEHEVGYFFTLSPHTRPNEGFTERVDAPQIEYITVGGMEWDSSQWVVGGLNAEWGEDKHV